jgi:hypothetical protein
MRVFYSEDGGGSFPQKTATFQTFGENNGELKLLL